MKESASSLKKHIVSHVLPIAQERWTSVNHYREPQDKRKKNKRGRFEEGLHHSAIPVSVLLPFPSTFSVFYIFMATTRKAGLQDAGGVAQQTETEAQVPATSSYPELYLPLWEKIQQNGEGKKK